MPVRIAVFNPPVGSFFLHLLCKISNRTNFASDRSESQFIVVPVHDYSTFSIVHESSSFVLFY